MRRGSQSLTSIAIGIIAIVIALNILLAFLGQYQVVIAIGVLLFVVAGVVRWISNRRRGPYGRNHDWIIR